MLPKMPLASLAVCKAKVGYIHGVQMFQNCSIDKDWLNIGGWGGSNRSGFGGHLPSPPKGPHARQAYQMLIPI
jgi:hypothetical protein